jgi:hypothetical protein
MDTIIYTKIENTKKEMLLKEVSKTSNIAPAMVFDFKGLFNLLRSKISGYVIIIFLISSMEELEYLDSKRDYLSTTRYIIILPDGEKKLVSKALSLYPRYLAYANEGFKDVSAVLNKMVQNITREES